MSKNNHVQLIGNIGSEPKTIKKPNRLFVAFSMATKESFKDEQDNWQETSPTWHRVLAFNPTVVAFAKTLKKGDRVEVIGSLTYRPVEAQSSNHPFKRMEASIVANSVALKPINASS